MQRQRRILGRQVVMKVAYMFVRRKLRWPLLSAAARDINGAIEPNCAFYPRSSKGLT
jgi:hypothetical protein